MFCAKCGKEIPQGYGFCPNCGAQVVRTVMQNAQDNVQQAANTGTNYAQQTAGNMQQAAANANPYIQQAAGNAQQAMNNANPYAQQNNANPYVQQNFGAAQNYGQRPGPNTGGYTPQYGQNPQMGYQQPNYQQNPQNDYGQQSFTVPEKKSNKGLMIGIAAAAVIAIAAILLFVWPGFLSGGGGAGSPEKTIQNFGAALQKMDVKGMVKCFDPASQKKLEGTIDQLGDMNMGGLDLSSLIDMMNLKIDMNVTNVDYSPDKTTCRANVHMKMSYSFMGYSDSQEEDAPIDMIKVDGNWYLDGSKMDLEDMLGDIMGGIY